MLGTMAAASSSLCSPVRSPPPLYSPPLPFSTNFTNKTQALEFFDEGWGVTNTAGSLACRRTDHLSYNVSFGSEGAAGSGALRGLRIVMDDRNGSSCHRDSQTATGHLLTKTYMPASGGRIELLARVGYGTDAATGFRSPDSFSCLGLYVHDSVSASGYRNEISMCVSSADTSVVRMGVWVGDDGDVQRAFQANVGRDLAQSFNLLAIDWSPTRVRFSVNEEPIWVVDGQSFCAGNKAADFDAAGVVRLPFEPMSVRVILRPRGREYQPPPTFMDVARFSYTPLPDTIAGGASSGVVGVQSASFSSSSSAAAAGWGSQPRGWRRALSTAWLLAVSTVLAGWLVGF